MKYFAYGSNMSVKRLQHRTPSAQPIGIYSLTGHVLRFHQKSKDGSGKCNAWHTGIATDVVIGVLFDIHPQEKPNLDQVEGLGFNYDDKKVIVSHSDGHELEAVMYSGLRIDDAMVPYDWYKHHVLTGALEAGLPSHYVRLIESYETKLDLDAERRARERLIHGLG